MKDLVDDEPFVAAEGGVPADAVVDFVRRVHPLVLGHCVLGRGLAKDLGPRGFLLPRRGSLLCGCVLFRFFFVFFLFPFLDLYKFLSCVRRRLFACRAGTLQRSPTRWYGISGAHQRNFIRRRASVPMHYLSTNLMRRSMPGVFFGYADREDTRSSSSGCACFSFSSICDAAHERPSLREHNEQCDPWFRDEVSQERAAEEVPVMCGEGEGRSGIGSAVWIRVDVEADLHATQHEPPDCRLYISYEKIMSEKYLFEAEDDLDETRLHKAAPGHVLLLRYGRSSDLCEAFELREERRRQQYLLPSAWPSVIRA